MASSEETRESGENPDRTLYAASPNAARRREGRLAVGTRLGDFEIVRFIAQGGMGEVYEARQRDPDRRAAIKILGADPEGDDARRERFFKEIRMSGRLDHPNIVSFYDAGSAGGHHYLAMAFVDGPSALDRVNRSGPMDEPEALRTVTHVARALDEVWRENQLLHRDVKPGNILFDQEGRVRLTDFGLSTLAAESGDLTLPDLIIGSPEYMSPEQIRCPVDLDPRTDIYALGCTLYFLLTGRPPFFAAQTTEVLHRQLHARIPDPRLDGCQVGEGVWRLLQGMMVKDRDGRYPGWGEVLGDLHDVRRGRLPTRWTRPRKGLLGRVFRR